MLSMKLFIFLQLLLHPCASKQFFHKAFRVDNDFEVPVSFEVPELNVASSQIEEFPSFPSNSRSSSHIGSQRGSFSNFPSQSEPDFIHAERTDPLRQLQQVPDQYAAPNTAVSGFNRLTPSVPNALRIPADPNASKLPAIPNASRLPAVPNSSRIPAVLNASRLPSVPNASRLPSSIPNVQRLPPQAAPRINRPHSAVPNASRLSAVPNASRLPAVSNASRLPAVPNASRLPAVPNASRLPSVLPQAAPRINRPPDAVPNASRIPAVPNASRLSAVPNASRLPAVPNASRLPPSIPNAPRVSPQAAPRINRPPPLDTRFQEVKKSNIIQGFKVKGDINNQIIFLNVNNLEEQYGTDIDQITTLAVNGKSLEIIPGLQSQVPEGPATAQPAFSSVPVLQQSVPDFLLQPQQSIPDNRFQPQQSVHVNQFQPIQQSVPDYLLQQQKSIPDNRFQPQQFAPVNQFQPIQQSVLDYLPQHQQSIPDNLFQPQLSLTVNQFHPELSRQESKPPLTFFSKTEGKDSLPSVYEDSLPSVYEDEQQSSTANFPSFPSNSEPAPRFGNQKESFSNFPSQSEAVIHAEPNDPFRNNQQESFPNFPSQSKSVIHAAPINPIRQFQQVQQQARDPLPQTSQVVEFDDPFKQLQELKRGGIQVPVQPYAAPTTAVPYLQRSNQFLTVPPTFSPLYPRPIQQDHQIQQIPTHPPQPTAATHPPWITTRSPVNTNTDHIVHQDHKVHPTPPPLPYVGPYVHDPTGDDSDNSYPEAEVYVHDGSKK